MAEAEVGADEMVPRGVVCSLERVERRDIQARLLVPFPTKRCSESVQSVPVCGRVVTEPFRLLTDRTDVGRFAGMEDRRHDQSLAERSLIIAGNEVVEMSDISDLEVRTVLQVFCQSACRSAQLGTKRNLALIVKTITRLDEDRIIFEMFYIACVDASNDLMACPCKDLARVRRVIRCGGRDGDERQEIADVKVGERRDESQFVERFKRMRIDIGQQVIYLARRKEIELLQFFFGSGVQLDGRLMKGIQVVLELFVVRG